MMRGLVGLELAMLRRERHAWWSLVALVLLALLSFASIAAETARSDDEMRRVSAAERARWVGQGEKDPHSAAHYSIFAFKPAPALTPLDPGAGPFVGRTVWLEAHRQNDMLYRPRQNASALERAGFGSPSALLIGFGPLVVFLIAFALVARDRERGTMRLALGTARHPRSIVLAKGLATWLASAALLVAPLVAAALAWLLATGRCDGDTLVRLGGWAAVQAGYLGIATAAGVAVALVARDTRVALVTLFGLWVVFALILPRVASSAADGWRPLPSSQSVRQDLLEAAPSFWSDEENARNRAQLMRRYGVARIEDIPNPRMAELDLRERRSHRVFDRVLGGFYGRVAGQDRLFAWLGILSPAVAAQALSAALVGSDFSHHRGFIDAAERYRRNLVNRMNADGMAHRAHGTERHLSDARLWASIPAFDYAAPALGARTATAWPSLAMLALWLGIAAGLFVVAIRRLAP